MYICQYVMQWNNGRYSKAASGAGGSTRGAGGDNGGTREPSHAATNAESPAERNGLLAVKLLAKTASEWGTLSIQAKGIQELQDHQKEIQDGLEEVVLAQQSSDVQQRLTKIKQQEAILTQACSAVVTFMQASIDCQLTFWNRSFIWVIVTCCLIFPVLGQGCSGSSGWLCRLAK